MTIAVRQAKIQTNDAGGTSVTVALDAPMLGNSTAVVWLEDGGAGLAATPVSDDQANTYVKVGRGAAQGRGSFHYCLEVTGGEVEFTGHLAASNWPTIAVAEITADNGLLFEAGSDATFNSGTVPVTSVEIATAHDNVILLTGESTDGGDLTIALTSPFSVDAFTADNQGWPGGLGHAIVDTQGTYSAIWTGGVGTSLGVGIMALYEPTVTPPLELSGTGMVDLSGPAWIRVAVTIIEDVFSFGSAYPRNYYHVALLSWGTANGVLTAHPITRLNEIIQLPPGMTRLYYWVNPAASLEITPLTTP